MACIAHLYPMRYIFHCFISNTADFWAQIILNLKNEQLAVNKKPNTDNIVLTAPGLLGMSINQWLINFGCIITSTCRLKI